MTGETGKPRRAYRRAGAATTAKSSDPKRASSAAHAETAPGIVTEPQPRSGVAVSGAFRDQAAGDRPEAFSPCNG